MQQLKEKSNEVNCCEFVKTVKVVLQGRLVWNAVE